MKDIGNIIIFNGIKYVVGEVVVVNEYKFGTDILENSFYATIGGFCFSNDNSLCLCENHRKNLISLTEGYHSRKIIKLIEK